MKKVLFLVFSLVVAASAQYDANAAVRYAKKWVKPCNRYGCPQNWNIREYSEYDSYSGGATDCANFVSQALEHGGKLYDSSDDEDYDPGWYENYDEENRRHADFWFSKKICSMNGDTTDKGDSIAWVRASALRTRLAYGYTHAVKIYSEKNTKVGDVIFFRKKGDSLKRPRHVGIVTKKVGGRVYFSAHTHDRYNKCLDTFSSTYYFEFYRPW